MTIKNLIFFNLFFAIALLTLSKAFAYDIQELSESPTWNSLLHMSKGESKISDRSFFLAPNGGTDSEAELLATISAFKSNPSLQCRFPARSFWLRKHSNLLDSTDSVRCVDLDEFKNKVAAKQLYLVFASEKMPSPTSMMGHLFIKILGEREDGFKPEHSLSFFAAIDAQSNALSFIPKALVSGTNGRYMLKPYEETKHKYEELEGRQLHEFSLQFSEEELMLIMLHAWELKDTGLKYSLAYDNCATAIIPLLAVGNPQLKKLSYKPYITPFDLLDEMSEKAIVNNEEGLQNLSKKSRSANIQATYGETGSNSFVRVSLQPAYKHVMEQSNAEVDAEVNLFSASVNVHNQSEIDIENLTVFKTKTYIPNTLGELKPSKYFELSLQNIRYAPESKLAPSLSAGLGYQLEVMGKRIKPYLFALTEYRYYSGMNSFSVLPELGLISNITSKAKLKAGVIRRFSSENFSYKREVDLKLSYSLGDDLYFDASYYDAKTFDGEVDKAWLVGLRQHF